MKLASLHVWALRFTGPFCVGLTGCSSSNSLLPDQVGTTWTYDVRTGFGAQHVADLKVVRRLTVAGAEGFEVAGPMGSARLAWKSGALYAESFSSVRLQPAAPILRLDREPASWSGVLQTAFGEERASAHLTHRSERLKIGGRTFETVQTELSIERPLGSTTLTTWFSEGIGIIRQEQRTRGTLDLRIEWVAGPKSP